LNCNLKKFYAHGSAALRLVVLAPSDCVTPLANRISGVIFNSPIQPPLDLEDPYIKVLDQFIELFFIM
jgi:hypothetical protein